MDTVVDRVREVTIDKKPTPWVGVPPIFHQNPAVDVHRLKLHPFGGLELKKRRGVDPAKMCLD